MKKEINNPICQLNKLQELSEKISDLIYEGNLNQIKILDNERKRIINDFKKNYTPELNEKLGYNAERALLDAGVTEEAIIGGQVGSVVQLFTDLFYRGRKIGEPKPPPEPPKGQQDLFQDELDQAQAEKDRVQGAPKPEDLDKRKKEQDARDKRKDPQGDMFAQELEEERGRDKQMDLFDEADKTENKDQKVEKSSKKSNKSSYSKKKKRFK